MTALHRVCAVLCVSMALIPPLSAQPGAQESRLPSALRSVEGVWRPFQFRSEPPVSLGNSGRLDALLRAGRIYLSLQDAIALALENNLDIELQRYGPRLARTDILRAEAGTAIRGVSTSVAGATGASS
ncbi:MAG TPA: hypothetical protein VLH09_06580, partial [Bryobacteraceae bacterium]|nr:hypothetical protein [Bryobacteraceae bacterium]